MKRRLRKWIKNALNKKVFRVCYSSVVMKYSGMDEEMKQPLVEEQKEQDSEVI